MLVSGITTVWSGRVVPAYARAIVRRDWRGRGIRLARFAEMARFEMGSTVIVLVPSGQFDPGYAGENAVTVGQRLGHLWPAADHGTILDSGATSKTA
jgi:phosphatidylserine decarboxylase